jgi:aryl-alcohol dehydrogenase-like predicted oxidoreductase
VKIKRIGRTGLKVSEICLGTMTFGNQCDQSTSFAIMDRADLGGVNFLDTADVYPLGGGPGLAGRTEEFVGEWIKQRGARNRIVLATKCRGQMGRGANDVGLSRKHIMDAVEGSLRRLQTDCIDLYQTHGPDPETPIDETMRALDDLVRSGKVRYIGCSNYRAYELAKALWTSDKLGIARYDCIQPRYNILYREIESEILPLCAQEGVGVICYNPLAGGFLTGKYQKGQDIVEGTRFALGNQAGRRYQERYWHEAQFEAVEELKQVVDAHGLSLPQVAVAWVLRNPTVTSAIVGATSPGQLDQTLSSTDIALSDEVRDACASAWYNLPRPRDPAVALR